jgi:aminoglycoside phosphotransferase (APT) family kinase protein
MLSNPEHREAFRLASLDLERTEYIGEGWGTIAYRSGDFVVRLLKPACYEWGIDGGYGREPALVSLLEACGLPVPREARVIRNEVGKILGTSHRYLEGASAKNVRLRGGNYRHFAREVGAFLKGLHGVPLDQLLAIGVPEIDLGTEEYSKLVDIALPLLGPRGRGWLESCFEDFLSAGGSLGAPRVLIHGDINHDHLLTSMSGELLGVIDFADAKIGDPALDFAGLLNRGSWSFLRQVGAGYGTSFATDPDLERRTRFYIQVEALYQVYYGDRIDCGRERERGLRRIASRAAVATRAAR